MVNFWIWATEIATIVYVFKAPSKGESGVLVLNLEIIMIQNVELMKTRLRPLY